eukprot:Partr_v1_DN23235_c0_g1_i1_m35443 putative cyclopropane-fatty-acyl-phospholipid synthase
MSSSLDNKLAVPKKANYTVHPAPYPKDVPGFHNFKMVPFYGALFGTPLAVVLYFGLSLWFYVPVLAVTVLPSYLMFMWIDSILKNSGDRVETGAGLEITDYMTFKDAAMARKYYGFARIPMETFYEAYFDNKIDIKCDMLDLLENRHDWASFQFTTGHLKFLISNLIPEVTFHTRLQDESQVREHYDRGNDFYGAFLGPMMIYTSGIITDVNSRESLEVMQENKLNLILNKIQLKQGEKLL